MSAENEQSEDAGALLLWLESRKGGLNSPNNSGQAHVWIPREPGAMEPNIRHYRNDTYVGALRLAKNWEDKRAMTGREQEYRLLTAADGVFLEGDEVCWAYQDPNKWVAVTSTQMSSWLGYPIAEWLKTPAHRPSQFLARRRVPPKPLASIRARIRQYLGNGGLFNPEAMDHQEVRSLLIGIRDAIDKLK